MFGFGFASPQDCVEPAVASSRVLWGNAPEDASTSLTVNALEEPVGA